MQDSTGRDAATGGGGLLRAELLELLKFGAVEEAEVKRLGREVDSLTADLRSARREIDDLGATVRGFVERQARVWNALDRAGLMKTGGNVRGPRSHRKRTDRYPTPDREGEREERG
jgi:hypothetical protein